LKSNRITKLRRSLLKIALKYVDRTKSKLNTEIQLSAKVKIRYPCEMHAEF